MPKVNPFTKPFIKDFWKKKLASLDARLTVAEADVQIIVEGGTPVQGTYSCGDWTPDYEGVVAFGGWTAA
jgi:hypothetical protein